MTHANPQTLIPHPSKKHAGAHDAARHIAAQIRDNTLKEGDKLPSLREYARLYSLPVSAVVAAYDALIQKGLVSAIHGKGFFVNPLPGNIAPEIAEISHDESTHPYQRAFGIIWLMRQQLLQPSGESNLSRALPPPQWLAQMRLDKFHRQIARRGIGELFQYGSRFGNHGLRVHLKQKLARHMIVASEQQIMTTHGANHALDLIIRRHITPGDPVLVEEPGYYPLFGKLKLQGADMIGIPRWPDGPDIEVLEQRIKHTRARVFFIQSCGQNPTGSDVSLEKARHIAMLAARHHLLVVENDAIADFKPHALPRICAVDQLRHTLYVGSFSKSLSASLRAGFIAGPAHLVEELADIKMLLHVSGSEYAERILDVILTEGHFLRHVARLQDRVRAATREGIAILKGLGADLFCEPIQSPYLWVRFPGVADIEHLMMQLLPKGVVIAPGSIFMLNPRAPSAWTRLNVGYLQDPLFIRSLKACLPG